MVETSQDNNILPVDQEKERIGKTTKNGLSHIAEDLWESMGKTKNPSGYRIDGSRELFTQSFRPVLIPGSGLQDVQTSLWTKPETHLRQPWRSSWRRDSQGMVASGSDR